MRSVTENRPRRGRPGHDQQAVVAAAVEAFDECGYDATTMGQIAERLGVSKSAIYHHVEGKEELLTLALDTAFSALDAGLAAAEAPGADLEHDFERALADMVAVLVEHRRFVRLLLRLRGNTPAQQEALARRRAFDARMAGIIAAAQEAGVVREDLDATVLARLLFGALNSTVDWYRPDGRLSPEDLTRSVLAVVLHGVAA